MFTKEIPQHLADHAKLFLFLEMKRRAVALSDAEKHKYFIVRRALVEHHLLSIKGGVPTEQEAKEWGLLKEYRTYLYNHANPRRYILKEAAAI